MRLKNFQNNQGAIILQIVVVFALVGGLSVYMLNKSDEAAKINVKQALDNDVDLAMNLINIHLANPEKCVKTFSTNFTPDSIVSKEDGSEKIYQTIDAGGVEGYGNSLFKIVSYELVQDLAANKNTLFVKIQNKKFLEGKTGIETFVRRMNMFVQFEDPANRLF